MNAEKIIEYAKSAGMRLEVKGPKLMVYNPENLTDELRQEIRLHKPEIIRLLSANDDRLTNPEITDLLRESCSGIKLDPHQFWSFLDESDIADIRAGAVTLENLKAFARSWARYPELVPIGNTRPFPAFKEAEPVWCINCTHFSRDTIGDGRGIGKCQVNSEATIPTRYPRTERFCNQYKSAHKEETNKPDTNAK